MVAVHKSQVDLRQGQKFIAREELFVRHLVVVDPLFHAEPAEVAALVGALASGDCDVVLGSRFLEASGYEMGAARSLGRDLFRAVARRAGLRVTDPTSGFQALSRRALEFYAGDWFPSDYPDVDVLLCASSGTAALEAVLAAIDAGKTIALANKEVLVMAGAIVTAAAERKGVAVLPVDSEHNAIHQCLHGRRHEDVRRLILTASGGPFRSHSAAELKTIQEVITLSVFAVFSHSAATISGNHASPSGSRSTSVISSRSANAIACV